MARKMTLAAIAAALTGKLEAFILKHAPQTENPLSGQAKFAEEVHAAFCELAKKPILGTLLPSRIFWEAEELDYEYQAKFWLWYDENVEPEEDCLEEDYFDEIEEDCGMLLTEAFDFEEEDSLEEKRERELRKYDVLYGDDLEARSFDGPMVDKDKAAELAAKVYNAHLCVNYAEDVDPEDAYARGVASKLLHFLEWTPRTEFPYEEIMERLSW